MRSGSPNRKREREERQRADEVDLHRDFPDLFEERHS
jgi:hypothetical protein